MRSAGAFLAALLMILCPAHPAQASEISGETEGVPVPVLMYHSLCHEAGDQWVLDPDAFEADLRYLSDNGYTAVLVRELVDYVENGAPLPEKPVVLTFDDCYYNNYEYGLPLLEQYDMKMVLSVIGSYSEEFSETEDHNPVYAHLSWHELEELHHSGRVELANHTWALHTHENGRDGCCRMYGEDIDHYRKIFYDDVGRLQEKLTGLTGSEPICFTYPFGSKCDDALLLAREMGFKATLSCYEGMNRLVPGDADCLLDLRRCNRTPGRPAEQILNELEA